jgi:hypothetical protein
LLGYPTMPTNPLKSRAGARTGARRDRHLAPSAHQLVRWRGTDAPQYVAAKAAQAGDDEAWAFWLEVERAVKELLNEAVPPGATQH